MSSETRDVSYTHLWFLGAVVVVTAAVHFLLPCSAYVYNVRVYIVFSLSLFLAPGAHSRHFLLITIIIVMQRAGRKLSCSARRLQLRKCECERG